jgi:hypothetical protein
MTTTAPATATIAWSVGDQAHYRIGTDAFPVTVIKVTRTTVHAQEDHADRDHSWKPNIVPGGFAGHCDNQDEQRWIITRNTEGQVRFFTLRKSGRWLQTGSNESNHCVLRKGWKRFYDFNY